MRTHHFGECASVGRVARLGLSDWSVDLTIGVLGCCSVSVISSFGTGGFAMRGSGSQSWKWLTRWVQ